MQLFIRYNAQEGKQTKELLEEFHAYLISGPHAEFYSGAFSDIISTTRKPFVIDPHIYEISPDKRSDTKYVNALGIEPELYAASDKETRRQMIEKMLDYQGNRVNDAIKEDALEDVSGDFKPLFLIAPYEIIDEESALEGCIESIAISKELKPSDRVFGAILLEKEILVNRLIVKKIVEGFSTSKADGFCVSVADFKAENEPVEFLRAYKYLIEELSKAKRPIIALYGGFFDLLLSKHGITGIVHGVDTGERLVLGVGGGRKQPLRYYVPALKKKFSGADLDFIKVKAPELLECGCGAYNNGSMERNALLKHYINCRANEVGENEKGADQLAQIKQAYEKYKGILGYGINLEYLKRWVDALE